MTDLEKPVIKTYKDLVSGDDPDDRVFQAIARRIVPYTMTLNEGPEAAYALFHAVRYVVRNRIPGAMVECGVWRGGSMMLVAHALKHFGDSGRALYLYDTFEGMTAPQTIDVDFEGVAMKSHWLAATRDGKAMGFGGAVGSVTSYMAATGYPPERMHFIAGDVCDTIPAVVPPGIALLRLDTDWHKSTLHELTHLYDRLAPGGVLIIDDYGWCRGARAATDEFFAARGFQPLLQRLNQGARLLVKPGPLRA